MIDLTAPIHALPLDMARVIIGGVVFAYFLHILLQARDFSDPNGLIDHRLSMRLVPPTRLSAFHPGLPGIFFRIVFVCACLASLLVVLGYHPRVAALFLFVVAVSTYRWNVLVAYLDDAMIHVFCLWLALLPVGHTLTLPDLLAGGQATDAWLTTTVPGATTRAFLANMALVYLVAGLYKFTSPMWRNGSAMHAALRMPIAHAPGFWTLRYRVPLRAVTHAALISEPLFALIFVLPAGSVAKWPLVAGAVIFHLGIVLTLKIPYSNLAMLGALPISMGPELMNGRQGVSSAASVAPLDIVAFTLVALVALMMVWEATSCGRRLRERHSSRGWDNPVRPVLWVAGIYQGYRLFDWVDERNYHVRYEVRRICGEDDGGIRRDRGHKRDEASNESGDRRDGRDRRDRRGRRVDPNELFPQGMRYLLLQSYLVGNIWLQMSPEKLDAVRRSLLLRHARRYARTHPDAGTLDVVAIVQRVTADNLELTRGERRPLMRFTCRGGEAVMHSPL